MSVAEHAVYDLEIVTPDVNAVAIYFLGGIEQGIWEC